MVKETAPAKFDESIDLALKLGVDPKKHSIRGTVLLPGGSGKNKRVAVIAKPDKVAEAEAAGAVAAGGDELIQKISGGWLDFDVIISTPDMMPAVGKLGKLLGTKGLMPNPKSGTVTNEVGKTVKEFQGAKVEFKMDKNGALHMLLGKVSFEPKALEDNFRASLSAVTHLKPSGLKGAFVESITLSSTMGPGIKIDPKVALDVK